MWQSPTGPGHAPSAMRRRRGGRSTPARWRRRSRPRQKHGGRTHTMRLSSDLDLVATLQPSPRFSTSTAQEPVFWHSVGGAATTNAVHAGAMLEGFWRLAVSEREAIARSFDASLRYPIAAFLGFKWGFIHDDVAEANRRRANTARSRLCSARFAAGIRSRRCAPAFHLALTVARSRGNGRQEVAFG